MNRSGALWFENLPDFMKKDTRKLYYHACLASRIEFL